MGNPVTRMLKRLTTTTSELESQDLQSQAAADGCDVVAACHDRQVVVIRGTLRSVTVNPSSGRKWLEADLDDGTAVVVLVWMGRRKMGGIEAGRHLRVEGRLSYVDGRRTIYNPRYELLS